MIELDTIYMARALELAARGEGHVEPNPMVGCVLVRSGEIVGEGWHTGFGEPHAEVHALRAAGSRAAGSTAYVTLEPCAHHGKTPPCTDALIAAGVVRVVVALGDPFSEVDGNGIEQLRQAGIDVECGVLEADARELCAPYLKLTQAGRPWVIAKWAMTLDGKLATSTGDSQWISSEASRAIVHQLRGRMDAILVGSHTAARDNPQLTARPPGPRVAARIVVDSRASLPVSSKLAKTAEEVPVVVAVGSKASPAACDKLAATGCEILACPGETHAKRLDFLLGELGRRKMTNVLVEGGGTLLGTCFDRKLVDEAHVFIAPKILGGAEAISPVAGEGISAIADAYQLREADIRTCGADVYVSGRIAQ